MEILKEAKLQGFGERKQGKVRDMYVVGDKRIIVATDRISAFDRILGYIPDKGQILTELSEFWFGQTRDIVPNHFVDMPDPNVLIVQNETSIPIEMVVRGYMTGVTDTSVWGSYERGEREIYGVTFPDGLTKNKKLPIPIITPTTKAEQGHDERLTRGEIIKRRIISEEVYAEMEAAVLGLYRRGGEIASRHGLMLVDTKYEFGQTRDGQLVLIDEIHTPDSSRFWVKDTYEERIAEGQEPDNVDKEYLRLWYAGHGYRGEGTPPQMPEDLVRDVGGRYITVFEKLTGRKFTRRAGSIDEERIWQSLETNL